MERQTWFYAYTQLKRRDQSDKAPRLCDISTNEDCIDLLANVMTSSKLPHGDGKFSRLKNYLENVNELSRMIKEIWSDENTNLTMALALITATIECVLKKAEQIEKSP